MNRILVICQLKKQKLFEEVLQDFILEGAELYFAEGENALSLLEEKKPQLIFAEDHLVQKDLFFYEKQPHCILLSESHWEKLSTEMKKREIRESCKKYLKLEKHSDTVPM